jgi:hypothetical protein
MASVPYGSYFYGRSRYGNPGYHFAEAAVAASTGVSAVPSVVFNIPDAGTINVTSGLTAIGNHIFQTATVSTTQSSTVQADCRRIKLGILTPGFITELSNVITFGHLVGQAETDIRPISSLTSTGQQIDIGELTISAVAQLNIIGQQIDLGDTNINATSTLTSIGQQIDLGIVDIISAGTVISVGTQIDLGASASANAKSDVLTVNKIFTQNNIDVEFDNVFKLDSQTQGTLNLKYNLTNNIFQNNSNNSGNTFALSQSPDGYFNTTRTHLSVRTDNTNKTYLQVQGAFAGTTGGGTSTSQKRTVYRFLGDTQNQPPTYTGSAWPYVYYITQNPIKDDLVTATLGEVAISGYKAMTINGYPAYQYTGDTSKDTANGAALAGWVAFEIDGTPQSNAPGTFISDSTIYETGVTTTGTVGVDRKLTLSPPTTTPILYYFSLENAAKGGGSEISELIGVESTFLLAAESNFSAISGLTSIGIRKYFLESAFTEASSVSLSGELKWEQQSAPPTVWTEQKIAQTP